MQHIPVQYEGTVHLKTPRYKSIPTSLVLVKTPKKVKTIHSFGTFGFYLTYQTAVHLFAFLGLDLPQVELELLAFQYVAVGPATLAGSGSNASCGRETPTFNYLQITLSTHQRSLI